MTVKRGQPEAMAGTTPVMTAAAPVNAASNAKATSNSVRSGWTCRARRPPTTAPTRKLPSAQRLAAMEKPGAPAAAKPMRTTLPVMLAVKTCPRPR